MTFWLRINSAIKSRSSDLNSWDICVSPGPLLVFGRVLFRHRGPVHQVHRYRHNHGLEHHTTD